MAERSGMSVAEAKAILVQILEDLPSSSAAPVPTAAESAEKTARYQKMMAEGQFKGFDYRAELEATNARVLDLSQKDLDQALAAWQSLDRIEKALKALHDELLVVRGEVGKSVNASCTLHHELTRQQSFYFQVHPPTK